jgi:hypothetical protein
VVGVDVGSTPHHECGQARSVGEQATQAGASNSIERREQRTHRKKKDRRRRQNSLKKAVPMVGDYHSRTIEVPKRRQEKNYLKDSEDWNCGKVLRFLKNGKNDLWGIEDCPQRPREKT